MRSIMNIACSQVEDIYNVETQMACLEMFVLGGDCKNDDGLETSLSSFINNASLSSSNAITNLIAKIATRYSISISQKFVAQAVPVIGGIGGSTINYVFIDHFQNMATAHFTIKN